MQHCVDGLRPAAGTLWWALARRGQRAILCAIGAVLVLTSQGLSEAVTITVAVHISGLPTDQHTATVVLWTGDGQGFPDQLNHAVQVRSVRIHATQAQVTFKGLTPGAYAVSVYHDANANNQLDTTWYGRPTEATGVSNNPSPRMRAPTFREVRFTLAVGEQTIEIRLRQPN